MSPPLTRTSTRTGSDFSAPLDTPYGDLPLSGQGRGKAVAGSGVAGQRDGVRVRTSSGRSSRSGIRSVRGEDDLPVGYRDEAAAADQDSYFALPARQGGAAALDRRGTTRELIGRFESMERRAPSRSGSDAVEKPLKDKDKGKSPIRQSLRNLLSVFKKPKVTQAQPLASAPTSLPGTRYRPAASPTDIHAGAHSPGRPSLTLQIPSVPPPAQTDPRNCISPVSAHAGKQGPLLYLARPSTGSDGGPDAGARIPPVWLACHAQLHTTHVLVSWATPQGNGTSRLVPFTACADVRSLALGELPEDERGALPGLERGAEGAGREMKVFELQFEGRAREKFAAEGVAERAGWVSAIWDAVLLAQENRPRTPAVSECFNPSPLAGSTAAVPAVSPLPPIPDDSRCDPTTTASRISRMSTSSTNRALPAVPDQTPEKPPLPRLNLRDLPPVPARQPSLPSGLSPLPAPPVTPTSTRGSSFLTPDRAPESPSRTQSPSIRNLDQRSVVKQRLAQIEQSRTTSPVSPSTRRWEFRDAPASSSHRMQRQGSSASSAAASILNSYSCARTEAGSPRSPCSGRLTTVPPSPVGSPPPRVSAFNRRGTDGGGQLLGLPDTNEGLFSPASRYSVDNDSEVQANSGGASQLRSALEVLAIPLPPSTQSIAPLATTAANEVGGNSAGPVLERIYEGVEALRGRSATDSTNIVNIRTKVDEVLGAVHGLRTREDGDRLELVADRVGEVHADIKGDLTRLQGLVEDLKGTASTPAAVPDIAQLQEKLDSLLQLSQGGRQQVDGDVGSATTANELVEVVTLLRDAEEQRVTQMEQQTDSIRYLNELNSWLEAFVKHGTSQIEGVAAGVQQLCKDLGPVPELQDVQEGEPSTPGTLLSDIRRFLVQQKEREECTTNLHASVNGLVAAVQEDLRRNAEARNMLTTDSVIGMIDRQRQDQERMLKALAMELSDDIRGERLRFVEAMKEATAINVQIHVEEFKNELTREVMLMTQEVTRLQRERQGLEQQIADLFAFYAKQKQAGKVVDGGRMPFLPGALANQPTLAVMPGSIMPPSSQSVYRRPLPSPAPSPTR